VLLPLLLRSALAGLAGTLAERCTPEPSCCPPPEAATSRCIALVASVKGEAVSAFGLVGFGGGTLGSRNSPLKSA
jgi:hypothetical protein